MQATNIVENFWNVKGYMYVSRTCSNHEVDDNGYECGNSVESHGEQRRVKTNESKRTVVKWTCKDEKGTKCFMAKSKQLESVQKEKMKAVRTK